ncbi:MAG: DNA-directed RNA polymerase subunit N [Candidatus Bathyarchaeia archaeon]
MMIPVRCFTCGEVVGDKWEEYISRLNRGEDPSRILDDLGLKKYCCRRTLISHVEVIDEVLKYAEHMKEPGGR